MLSLTWVIIVAIGKATSSAELIHRINLRLTIEEALLLSGVAAHA